MSSTHIYVTSQKHSAVAFIQKVKESCLNESFSDIFKLLMSSWHLFNIIESDLNSNIRWISCEINIIKKISKTFNNKFEMNIKSTFDILQCVSYVFLVLEAIMLGEYFIIIWPIKFLWLAAMFIIKGAKPYHPFFVINLIADFFGLIWIQISAIVLLTWYLAKYRFYGITIVDQGKYHVGFKCIKKEEQELAIYYPTTEEGEPAMWIQTKDYFKSLHDLAFINPLQIRWVPLSMFRFFISYMSKIKIPVQTNAKLEILDPEAKNASIFLFSHGLSTNMTSHSSYCSWLASHGFIVISLQYSRDLIRFPYDEELLQRKQLLSKLMYISKNEDLQVRSRQLEAVYIELIEGSLLKRIFPETKDLQIVDIRFCGHSFGGATCMETVANLERKQASLSLVREIIAIDPWVYPLSESTLNHHFNRRIAAINSETFMDSLPSELKMKQNLGMIKRNNLSNFSGYVLMGSDHVFSTDFVFVCGNGIQLMTKCKKYSESLTFYRMLQTITLLTIEKKSSESILEACYQRFNDKRLYQKNVCVVNEDRCDSV